MGKYRILEVPQGGPPKVAMTDSPFTHAKQLLGGAYIQMVQLDDGVFVFCDEDGISKGLELNHSIPVGRGDRARYVHHIHGPFVLGRHDAETDTPTSLSDADVTHYEALIGGVAADQPLRGSVQVQELLHSVTTAIYRTTNWAVMRDAELEARGARAYSAQQGEWTFLIVTIEGFEPKGTASGPRCAMLVLPPALAQEAARRIRETLSA